MNAGKFKFIGLDHLIFGSLERPYYMIHCAEFLIFLELEKRIELDISALIDAYDFRDLHGLSAVVPQSRQVDHDVESACDLLPYGGQRQALGALDDHSLKSAHHVVG